MMNREFDCRGFRIGSLLKNLILYFHDVAGEFAWHRMAGMKTQTTLFTVLAAFFAAVLAGCAAPDTAQPRQAAALPAAVNTDPSAAARNLVLPEPANPALPSVILIGDSTVRNGRDDGQGKGPAGQWGWGNPLADYFDQNRINVVNRAIGGLSSRTYLTGGHWERTLAFVKAGDVVIMQFGHNDASAINDNSRARGTIAGTGDEAQEIDNILTGKHETVHSYGWYLRRYIADIRARGAVPVICTPVPRKRWDAQGKIARGANSYPAWAAQVAREEKVGLIDLAGTVARQYDALGRDAVMQLFPQTTPDENTHTNRAGAELNARAAIAGIKALRTPALVAALSPKANDIAPAEDERPVVDAASVPQDQPRNAALPSLFLVGDSTVRSGGANGAVGWGERIAPYFDTGRVNVVNHAIGGRSSRTFYTEGRWDKVLAQLKAGDVVLIQFGHNDGGRIGDPAMKNRASGAGTGAETVEEAKPDGTREQVHTFGWYMARYVASARARGAHVVLLSPVPHRDRWQQGRDFEQFAQWDAQVARAEGAQFADLTMAVADGYHGVGAQQVDGFFSDARTHTNDLGAQFNAQRVVAVLKGLPDNPVAAWLSARGQAVAPAVPR
jgi:lysophospholipase L1-like esterase